MTRLLVLTDTNCYCYLARKYGYKMNVIIKINTIS
nr:MAG TPA: hypothetical protein [Caudoviricetes sp.]